ARRNALEAPDELLGHAGIRTGRAPGRHRSHPLRIRPGPVRGRLRRSPGSRRLQPTAPDLVHPDVDTDGNRGFRGLAARTRSAGVRYAALEIAASVRNRRDRAQARLPDRAYPRERAEGPGAARARRRNEPWRAWLRESRGRLRDLRAATARPARRAPSSSLPRPCRKA